MGIYLLKSVLCLGAFLAFYHVVLEREIAHKFKRFYLMASVLISFAIPYITFIDYVEIVVEPLSMVATSVLQETPVKTVNTETPIDYLSLSLWSLYILGVIVFGFRFCKNLFNISHTIRSNDRVKATFYTKVLMLKSIVPHSFFNYIFINRDAFEHQNIPEEVLTHEEAHVKQKHSADIIFIELLQIIFWFNPLFIYLKHAIKLNHEFLADAYVVEQKTNVTTYQNLLINFSSCTDHTALTSPLNYSLTKKRIMMLSKRTTKNSWLKSLLLLPLVAVLTLSFSTKKDVISYVTPIAEDIEDTTPEPTLIDLNAETSAEPSNEDPKENSELDSKAKKTVDASVVATSKSPAKPVTIAQKPLETMALKDISLVVTESIIMLNDEVVSMTNLTSRLNKITKKWSKAQRKDFDLSVSFSNVSDERREKINKAFKASNLGKANPEKELFMPHKPPRAPRAPRAIESQHDMEKRYEQNAKRFEKRTKRMEEQVEKREERLVERMEELEERREERMQKLDERKVEHDEERMIIHEERARKYEEALEERSLILEERAKMIEERGEYITKRYKDGKVVEVYMDEDDEELIPPVPPLPPMPPEINPIDLIVDMAKKGATFYNEGKVITSDEAITIVKNNKDINILANPNGKNGLYVKLSKSPIQLSKEK